MSTFSSYYSILLDKLRREHENNRRVEKEEDNAITGIFPLSEDLTDSTPIKPAPKISLVYFYAKENAVRHHTDKFELVQMDKPSVVLRRGNAFYIVIRFDKDTIFTPGKDQLRMLFNFGPNPSPMKGTQARLVVSDHMNFIRDDGKWAIRLHGKDVNSSITVQVRIPAEAPVGIWNCVIETKAEGTPADTEFLEYKCDDTIYILFNPWSKDDSVYMEDENLLEEYISSDVSKIWVGPYGSSRGRQWVYGQFDDSTLPVAMIVLEKSGVPFSNRGNPVQISRALSRMVNSPDDNGVVQGRWDGEYDDGTAPAAWTGSVPILESFLKDQKPVKYGQCWVFAGVLTTICRALGIPARTVSNLVSAHDANMSLTVDKYYDSKSEELEYDPHNPSGSRDSIWNFHVWTEAWMARPELPKGYGGWQAIDATPQELSEGFFQCGPASVQAVRRGEVGFAYDVPFVLAEVNADLVRWREDKESELGFTKIDSNKYHVGRMILTKKPGEFDQNGDEDKEDITQTYKNKEGTHTERLSLYNAVRGTSRAKRFFDFPSSVEQDVELDMLDIDRVQLGKPFHIIVDMLNKSSEPRTVHTDLAADSVYYTGVKAIQVKRAHGDFVLQPNSREQLQLTVTADEYADKLVEYCIMKIYALASVEETKQTWSEEDDFQVLKPDLVLEVEETLQLGRPAAVKFTFTNPLKKKLTKCQFRYEGPGLVRNQVIDFRDIQPEEMASLTHRIVPKRVGLQRLVGTFVSKELVDIIGSADVTVVK